jgi:hypothetical protein
LVNVELENVLHGNSGGVGLERIDVWYSYLGELFLDAVGRKACRADLGSCLVNAFHCNGISTLAGIATSSLLRAADRYT